MASNPDTPEVASIKSNIQSWLKTNQNKLDLDLTKDSIEFKQHSGNLFTCSAPKVAITIGFQDGDLTKNSTLDQFRSNFSSISLDHLPLPDLQGVPSQWDIYPQTPISSFSEGVTFEKYDPATQILQLRIQTGFFAIYGSIPQEPFVADRSAPEGTYLQVRQDIQGDIKLRAKLIFN